MPSTASPAGRVFALETGRPAMTPTIHGLHHITAISGPPQRNLDFYTRVLGLRLVKRTVNFDDPGTYHLYYGDEVGTPGTALTFFAWDGLPEGRSGVGEATLTQFSVPGGSLDFWQSRLEAHDVQVSAPGDLFGEKRLVGQDPDGLAFALVVPGNDDERAPWTTHEVGPEVAIRGFHGVTLTLAERAETGELLSELFGYEPVGQEGDAFRYVTPHAKQARMVDIVEQPGGGLGRQGRGSVHHIAFAVQDRAAQMAVRERLVDAGQRVTPQIDRNYFYSIYFRSPGGVLFEVATEEPGFTVDEPVAELGRSLKLPAQHEHLRATLERTLPPLEA
jgi:glyoxalase family protein